MLLSGRIALLPLCTWKDMFLSYAFLHKLPSIVNAGLAIEQSVYKKLLGVIEEIGIEVGKTTQHDQVSKDRLITSKYFETSFHQDLFQFCHNL